MAGLPRTLPEVLRKAIAGKLQDVHVALPGQVVRWDAEANLADVQVMVEHPVYDDDGEREYEDIGVLIGVPVAWPRAGGHLLTLPMAAGDSGLLVFCSTPIGEWRETGQRSQPEDARRHSIGWPIFYPGAFPDVSPPAAGDVAARQAGLVLGKDGDVNQLRITGSTATTNAYVDVGKGATDFVALASLVLARLEAIKTTFDAHTHVCAAAGSPSAPPVDPMTAPASVAAVIARAK